MVANESEALRWVARQSERRIETDVILNVYGKLREYL